MLSDPSACVSPLPVRVLATRALCALALVVGVGAGGSDWLIDADAGAHYPAAVATNVVSGNGTIALSNGLVERVWSVRADGAACTTELRHLRTKQTFFRAVSPEANVSLNGVPQDVGGCTCAANFEFFNEASCAGGLRQEPSAWGLVRTEQGVPDTPFPWSPRRHAPTNILWPPRGVKLSFVYGKPAADNRTEMNGVEVVVNYELYDGLPFFRKWVSVRNPANATAAVEVSELTYELLRAPNGAPERMTNVVIQPQNPTPWDQQLRPDPLVITARQRQFWFVDPNYDQCCDKEIHVAYSLYTFLAIGYGFNHLYGGPTGPGALVQPGGVFDSVSLRTILQDSSDPERQGLALRRAAAKLSPQLLENPINFMITDISSADKWRAAVDQAAETGQEIVIVGFGAAGFCGLCAKQLSDPTWVAWFGQQVAYATLKGIQSSAYTLMQHNGWGEVTPTTEQTLARDGKTRGPTACFATDFHANYRQSVIDFIKKVNLSGLETDGQYEDIPCADTGGDHHHNGIKGGYHYGLTATLDFNVELKSLEVYQTGADAYSWHGANRWNHADTDAFSRLPLWEQHTVGRMYAYDSTYTRLQTSGNIGVNDLAGATQSKCTGANGRTRMLCFDFVLASYYASGIVPGFRGNLIYNPQDPVADELKTTVSSWAAFYRKYASPRPSGSGGVLLGDLMHVRRPDSRHLEVVACVTADASAPERAIVSVVNPTLAPLSDTIDVPLYYAGLAPGAVVKTAALTPGFNGTCGVVGGCAGVAGTHTVASDGSISLTIGVAASSYAVILVSV